MSWSWARNPSLWISLAIDDDHTQVMEAMTSRLSKRLRWKTFWSGSPCFLREGERGTFFYWGYFTQFFGQNTLSTPEGQREV